MKVINYFLYYLFTAVYSVLIGVVAWSFLYVVNTVIHFLWIGHEGSGGFMYDHKLLILPFIWVVAMGLAYVYNRYEVIPRPGIKYAQEFKQNQKVVYKDFVKIYILALIPIFLGASVGPEAALIGLFFMMSSYIGDRTAALENKLGVVIKSEPQPKFIQNLKVNTRYLIKIGVIYVTVAYTLLMLLGHDKYPAFNVKMPAVGTIGIPQIIQIVIFAFCGYLLAKFYKYTEEPIEQFFEKIDNQYIKMSITAVLLSIFAFSFPILIMSGEATLHILVENPYVASGVALVIFAFLKIILTHICISGDLRGGHIFPIIFSAFLLGGGLAQIFGLNPTLVIASVTAAMTMTIFSSPIAIFLLLALFFPLRILSLIFIIVLIVGEKRAADSGRKEV